MSTHVSASLRGAERRSNPAFFAAAKLDCFASLAMTAEGPRRTHPTKQKARRHAGPFVSIVAFAILSGGFVLDGGIVALRVGIIVAIGIAFSNRIAFGLGAAARALGELALDFLDRFGLGRVLHDRDLAGQAVERRFIELAFAVRLLGLRFRAVEVANHFGDRDDVAG